MDSHANYCSSQNAHQASTSALSNSSRPISLKNIIILSCHLPTSNLNPLRCALFLKRGQTPKPGFQGPTWSVTCFLLNLLPPFLTLLKLTRFPVVPHPLGLIPELGLPSLHSSEGSLKYLYICAIILLHKSIKSQTV